MTGPEHYEEAERLIGAARAGHEDQYSDVAPHVIAARLAEAQVHATLALTAAIANTKAVAEFPLADAPNPFDTPTSPTWKDVIA